MTADWTKIGIRVSLPLLGALLLGTGANRCHAELKIDGQVVTAEDTAIYNELTNSGGDALSTEIFTKMVACTETFSFSSVDHAKQHFQIRKQIVGAINSMEQGGAIDFSMGPPYVRPPVTEVIPGKPFWFKAKPGVKASDVLFIIENGFTQADCAAAADSAVLIGHRRELGDDFIDEAISPGTLKFDKDIQMIDTNVQDTNTLIPGDCLYMKNKDDYEKKAAAKGKLTIAGLGENVIYIGGNKFSGLEMLNQTEGGIRENLRQIYERDTGETLDPEEAITAIRWTERARIQIIPFQSP